MVCTKKSVLSRRNNKRISASNGEHVINFCANNYLGLANNESLIEAAKKGLDSHGFGVASVRFICGTQDIHKQLEASISDFLGTEDTILYPSCFDANGGLFETLLGPEDAIISDALNHASIIDGVRLSKAQRYRYANNDMQELEAQLQKATQNGARFKLIATDGVFSMDGIADYSLFATWLISMTPCNGGRLSLTASLAKTVKAAMSIVGLWVV